MFESFGRGFRMIWASVKMGWEDKRLLLPSILTVVTNLVFGCLMLLTGSKVAQASQFHMPSEPALHGLIKHHGNLSNITSLNGVFDQSGWQGLSAIAQNENTIFAVCLLGIWWLTNRFLEGVTTALVYSHITEGSGTGKFSQACQAVFSSLPAIIVLGFVTLVVKKIAGMLRGRRGVATMTFGFNFLAGMMEIFWTLAGHLILPAIVIEGTSFWGGLKRADKIAQGNLLTIGIGEVGVDAICKVVTMLLYMLGVGGFAYAMYLHLPMLSPLVIMWGLFWCASVVVITAASIYIRAAFYTCLYAWAIEAETVAVTERARVAPPAPLAAALA